MSYNPTEITQPDKYQISMKNLKKQSRRAKTGQIIQAFKNKSIKPLATDITNESPYAQIQSLSKNRSVSNIKFKLPHKTHTSTLNSSSNVLLSKSKPIILANNSLNATENPHLKSRFLLNHPQNISTKASAKQIEDKLLENLKRFKEKTMTLDKFETIRAAFAEVIEKDEVFGTVLRKIKESYENKLKAEQLGPSKEVVEGLKDEMKVMKDKLKKDKENKKYLMKKIEKLAKENIELSRRLDDRESRYVDLQDKLIKLSKVTLEEIPTDEDSWKYLVSENQHLIKVCEDMRKDIKHLSHKEKKLVRLVIALKNRGFPVEDVYQEDVHREKPKKIKNCDEPIIDDSDNEDLISGRAKEVAKPEIIPNLNLKEIEISQDTSESSESSDYEESEEA